jgi:hypothetical protein
VAHDDPAAQFSLKVKGGFANEEHLTRIFKRSRRLVSA